MLAFESRQDISTTIKTAVLTFCVLSYSATEKTFKSTTEVESIAQHKQIEQTISETISEKMSSSSPVEKPEIKKPPLRKSTGSNSAVSARQVDLEVVMHSNKHEAAQTPRKTIPKLDLTVRDSQDCSQSMQSPKSPITGHIQHQASLTSSVDVEDRKTLREALYQGIFHRHRKTIFAMGSFLRMLRSRSSQYNTIRSSSEGEDIDKFR